MYHCPTIFTWLTIIFVGDYCFGAERLANTCWLLFDIYGFGIDTGSVASRFTGCGAHQIMPEKCLVQPIGESIGAARVLASQRLSSSKSSCQERTARETVS